jgi:hypothetical protein
VSSFYNNYIVCLRWRSKTECHIYIYMQSKTNKTKKKKSPTKYYFTDSKLLLYSHNILIEWDVITFSDPLSLTAWHVTTTNRWPFGMTKDTLEIVIQLDWGPATTEDVLFFSGSPATIHFIVEGGLLRSVLQLKFITSPGLASVGPLIITWLEPSACIHVKI